MLFSSLQGYFFPLAHTTRWLMIFIYWFLPSLTVFYSSNLTVILFHQWNNSFVHSIQWHQKIFRIPATIFSLTYSGFKHRNSSIGRINVILKQDRPQYCYRNLNLTHRKNGLRTRKPYLLIKLPPFFTLWCRANANAIDIRWHKKHRHALHSSQKIMHSISR